MRLTILHMPPRTPARQSNSRFGMCRGSALRRLDAVRRQPVADPPEHALLLENEPALALVGNTGEHVLESAERSLARNRDLEQLSEPGLGHGPDECLHVAVTLLRIFRLDGQESARRILLDLLDGERQLVFLFLTESEHEPRLGVEDPGAFALLILERPAELFQIDAHLLRHAGGSTAKHHLASLLDPVSFLSLSGASIVRAAAAARDPALHDESRDQRGKLAGFNRLRQVRLAPGPERLAPILRPCKRRQSDGRDPGAALAFQLTHPSDQAVAISVRHPDVADQDIGPLALECREPIVGGPGA